MKKIVTDKVTHARHGDLVISRINADVKGKKQKRSVTLAEGEFTGHSHQLKPRQGGSIIFNEPEPDVKEVQILEEPAELTHEEHETIVLNPGSYRIEIQKEYDYFEEQMKTVRD